MYPSVNPEKIREESKKHIEFVRSVDTTIQRSEQWFADRYKRLTSSDAATALGINPYKKPVQLLLEKCGAGRPFTGNESTLHGQKYEDEAIERYASLMGKKNHEFGMIGYELLNPTRKRNNTEWLAHEDYQFLGGSPDGIAEDTSEVEPLVMLEVKCPLRRKIKHGQVPAYYYPQVQLNMFILDLEIADFIEYFPPINGKNMELNVVRVHRCDEWFRTNVPILRKFWNEVLVWRTRDIKTHPEYTKYAYIPPSTSRSLVNVPDYLFVDDGIPVPVSSVGADEVPDEPMFDD